MALSLALYAATEEVNCLFPSAGMKRSLSFVAAPLPGHEFAVCHGDSEFAARFLPSKLIDSAELNINVRMHEKSSDGWQPVAFFNQSGEPLLAVNFSLDSETFAIVSRKVIDAGISACIDLNLEGPAIGFDPFDDSVAEIKIQNLGENPGIEIAGWRISFLSGTKNS